jgi:hypothetical protein
VTGWNSTIPGTLAALVTLWENAPSLSEVLVSDGPRADVGDASEVTVGYNGESDDSVTGVTTTDGFGGNNKEEYTILCAVVADTGDETQDPARTAAFTIYNACCEALRADPTLGGLALHAMPGDFTVRQQAGTVGRACLILFGVNVIAYTTT